MSSVKITLQGTKKRLETIINQDFLSSVQQLLQNIESEIKSNLYEYEGSEYISDYIHNVFPTEKTVRFAKNYDQEEGQESLLLNEPWYAYNANYGTSEERAFVSMFAIKFQSLKKKFINIHVIRNERVLKIFDKKGNAFEPDFVLFCKQNEKDGQLTFQVFIEPKGSHLKEHDKWKNDFLKEIRTDKKTIKIHTDEYLITGIPFYNLESENEFIKEMDTTLNL